MKNAFAVFLASLFGIAPVPVLADQQRFDIGGDVYVAGEFTTIASPVQRDAFVAGSNVTLSAPVTGDAHLAGFDVQSSSAVGGNLYVAGFSVSIGGSVKGDVTALGNAVLLYTEEPVAGNLRAAGATVTVDNEVLGAALITANTATVNASIAGDLSFYGDTLTFGSNARVTGNVLIHAAKPIDVPASVAPAERVSFTLLTSPEYPTQVGQTAEIVAKGFWATLWAATVWWVLLFVVGVALILLTPRWIASLETLSAVRPMRRLGLGVLGFAAVIGLVPVVALTVIGLLVVPVALIAAFVLSSLAYVVGVDLIGHAIGGRFVPLATTGRKIAVLAVSFAVAGLLTLVPFLGWLITLGIIAYGFGVMVALIMTSWSADDKARLSAQATEPTSSGATPDAV